MRLHPVLYSVLALVLWPMTAEAWRVNHYCNGEPSSWDGRQAYMLLARDPVSDDWGRAMEQALLEWNNVPGAWPIFDWEAQPNLRRAATGNGLNEFGVVRASAIDGALGLTRTRRRLCAFNNTGRIIESDVFINGEDEMYESSIPNCDQHIWGSNGDTSAPGTEDWDVTREATMLHELGHALGLQHEDQMMSLMMSTRGEGRYCGSPQFAPHPDDVAGIRRLYGDGAVVHDLAASSFELEAPDNLTMTMPRRTVYGCRGQIVSMRWSVANRGTEPVTYDILWYASVHEHFSSPDDLFIGAERGLQIAPAQFETRQTNVRVSRWQSVDDSYFVRFELVPDVPHERYIDNNYSYTATRLHRIEHFLCP